MRGRDVILEMNPIDFGIQASQISPDVPVTFDISFRTSSDGRSSTVSEVNSVSVRATRDIDDPVFKAAVQVPRNTQVGYHRYTITYGVVGRSQPVIERMSLMVNDNVVSVMNAIDYANYENEMFSSNGDYRDLVAALSCLKERMVKIQNGGPRDQELSQQVKSVDNRSTLEHAIHTSFKRHYREKSRLLLNNLRIGGYDENGEPRYPTVSELIADSDHPSILDPAAAVAYLIQTIPDNEFPVADYIEYSRIESGARTIRVSPYGGGREFSVGWELHDDVLSSERFATLVQNMEAAQGSVIDRGELIDALTNGVGSGQNKKEGLHSKRYTLSAVDSFKKSVRQLLKGVGITGDAASMCVDGLVNMCRGHVMTKVPGSDGMLRVKTSSRKKILLDILGTFYTGALSVGDTDSHLVSQLFKEMAWAEDMFLILNDEVAPTSTILNYLNNNSIFPEFVEYVDLVNSIAEGTNEDSNAPVVERFPSSLTPKQFAEYAKKAAAWKRNVAIFTKDNPSHQDVDRFVFERMEEPPQIDEQGQETSWVTQNGMLSPSDMRNMYPGDIFNIFSNTAPVRVSMRALKAVDFPIDSMKKLLPHFDGSDRISTVKIYEVLGSSNTDRHRNVNFSQYIPAAMEIDRRDSSMSIFNDIGVSCFPNVGFDHSNVPVSYMDMDMDSEFRFLRALIGKVWGFKEDHPDVYLKALRDMVPKEMKGQQDYRSYLNSFNTHGSVAASILTTIENVPESDFPNGANLSQMKASLSEAIETCESDIMNFIVAFRGANGGSLPSDAKSFKSAQDNAFRNYLKKAAESMVPNSGGNNAFPVDQEVVNMVISKKRYKTTLESLGHPRQIPDGSFIKDIESVENNSDIIINGEDFYDGTGNFRDVYIVTPDTPEGLGHLISPQMIGGTSVPLETNLSGMATGLDSDFRARYRSFSHDVRKGSQSHSGSEDKVSFMDGKDEPPLSKSAYGPPVSFGEMISQTITGRFGIWSLNANVNGTMVSDRMHEYLSDNALSVTNLDIGRHMYESMSINMPESERNRVEALIDSSVHMSAAMVNIYENMMERVQSGQTPVMWWRGSGANDMKDGFDLGKALDVEHNIDYYSGDALHVESSLDSAAVNAFYTAKEKALQEAALILSSPEGQNVDQKRAIISVISERGSQDIESYIQNFNDLIQEMASDEQEVAGFVDAVENEENDMNEILSDTTGETGIPSVDSEERDETPSDDDVIDDIDEDIVFDDDDDDILIDNDMLIDDDIDDDTQQSPQEQPVQEQPPQDQPVQEQAPQEHPDQDDEFDESLLDDFDDSEFDEGLLDDFDDSAFEEETPRGGQASSNGCKMMREALKLMAESSLRLEKEGKTDKSGEINKIIKRYIGGNGSKNN
jgi:hypothetical protein